MNMISERFYETCSVKCFNVFQDNKDGYFFSISTGRNCLQCMLISMDSETQQNIHEFSSCISNYKVISHKMDYVRE